MTGEPDRPGWRQFFQSRSWLANGLVIVAIALTFVGGALDSRGAKIALFVVSLVLIAVSVGVFVAAGRARRQQSGD
ncbi:MAG: hypothetical protein R3C15_21340 [Thermoleophilia bacterium]